MEALFVSLEETIATAIKGLHESDVPEHGGDEFWNNDFTEGFINVVNALAYDVNKLAVSLSSDPIPTVKEMEGMIKFLKERIELLQMIVVQVPNEAGRYYVKDCRSAVSSLMEEGIQEFIGVCKTVCLAKERSSKMKEQLLKSSGVVWEKCEAISSKEKGFPRSNIQSCCKVLRKEKALINDALMELEDALNSAEDDEDEFSERWSESEMKVVGPGTGLIKTARSLLKKIITTLEDVSIDSNKEVDDVTDTCTELSAKVDDFAICLYPSIQTNEVDRNGRTLKDTLQTILTKLEKDSGFVKKEDFKQWGLFLKKALNHNWSKLEASLIECGVKEMSVK